MVPCCKYRNLCHDPCQDYDPSHGSLYRQLKLRRGCYPEKKGEHFVYSYSKKPERNPVISTEAENFVQLFSDQKKSVRKRNNLQG